MPPAAAAATVFHSSMSFPSQNSNPTQLNPNPKPLLQKNPTYTSTTHANPSLSLQFKEKILCLEIMGVDATKALSQNPSLHNATLQSLRSITTYLQSKGIHQKDFARIFGMCPQILTSDIKSDINPVFDFLSHELQVPDDNFRRVINKCPRLLVSSVKNQLKSALTYLQGLGLRDLKALAYQDSILLVSNVERTLVPKLKYLESIGFSRQEAKSMVVRCPGLFTFSIENNFKPKFAYFSGVMGGKLEELREFPQYFAFSLEKRIKPRYMEVVQSGMKKMPLSIMLKSTEEQFRELIRQGCG